MEFLEYILKIHKEIFFFSCEHIFLSFVAIIMAVVIGIPMGIIITYYQKARKTILGAINIIQAVPSMALFGFLIPIIGIGKLPAIIIVVLYSLLPIVKNTYIGLEGINPLTIEAAEGIGMTKYQILQKVQLPLALPVIMGGVRIAVVTSVGLMTIAAFVGAGGLGYLVFSGIRTINNYQILAGAIPACILALLIDYFTGVLEKAVIPIGIQLNKKRSIFNNRKRKRILALTMFVGIFFTVIFSGMVTMYKPSSEKVIVMGSKEFTEGEILANIMAVMIEEKTDISIDRRFALGGTQICFNALKSNEIDMYVDYTGTVYGDTLKYPPIQDMEKVYDHIIKEFDAFLAKHGYIRENGYYRVEKESTETVTFFCHFGLICVLLSHLWNVSPFTLWNSLAIAPTSVTELYTEERKQGIAYFRASKVGDVSHLYAGEEEPSFAARFCEVYSNKEQRH